MSLELRLSDELEKKGAKFIRFVDISNLSKKQNKGYRSAILLGMPLSVPYLQKVGKNKDYVKEMIRDKKIQSDEFHLKELKTDKLADELAEYLQQEGYNAYSQSEINIEKTGYYDKEKSATPLPHKTIATLAGLGWIGKHNLLVTKDYGSAICMCSVLTDAPLETIYHEPSNPLCGNCETCIKVCQEQAIKGNIWTRNSSRDDLIDIKKCNTCIQCLVHCVYTQKYIKKSYSRLP